MNYCKLGKFDPVSAFDQYITALNTIKSVDGSSNKYKKGMEEFAISKNIKDYVKINFNNEILDDSFKDSIDLAIQKIDANITEIDNRMANISQSGFRAFLHLATDQKDVGSLKEQKMNLEASKKNLSEALNYLNKHRVDYSIENKRDYSIHENVAINCVVEEKEQCYQSPTPQMNEIIKNPGVLYLSIHRSAVAAGLIKDLNSVEADTAILLHADDKGNIHAYQWSYLVAPSENEGLIGKGSYGVVQKLKVLGSDLVKDAYVAIKAAFPNKKAINDIQKEVALLKFIHSDGIHEGIQPPPYAILPIEPKILDKNGNLFLGYMTLLCAGNLSTRNMFDATVEEGLEMSRQLLSGAATIERKGIAAGDINPRNILWNPKGNNENAINYYHADLGSGRFIPKNIDENSEFMLDPAHTPPFVCFLDLPEYAKLERNKKNDGNPQAINEVKTGRYRQSKKEIEEPLSDEESLQMFEELENKRDSYSLGATLIMKLGLPFVKENAGMETIFKLTHIGYSTGEFSEEGLQAKAVIIGKYGQEYWDLLERMVNPNYKLRPTRRQAFEIFTNKIAIKTSLRDKILSLFI